MSAHTPGPWRKATNLQGHTNHVVADSYVTVCSFLTSVKSSCDRDDIEANARLIAAAPDLLAALQSIAETVVYAPEGGHEEVSDCVRIAKQAIAKATGATP